MSEWKEVPAWEALKALQEGTHDVQWTDRRSTEDGWIDVFPQSIFSIKDHFRIRPKVRTVDVIGLPVPKRICGPYGPFNEAFDSEYWHLEIEFHTLNEARRAYEALCAASK